MTIQILPYFLLLLAVLVGWISTVRNSLIVLIFAIIAGLVVGRLSWMSLLPIFCLGLALWLPLRFRWQGPLKYFFYSIFLGLAVAMSNFLLPGFNNLPIYQAVRFSPDSVPFSMYLNFDKVLVGLFVILFFTRTSIRDLRPGTIQAGVFILAALVTLLLPIALGIQYIRFDLKFPELGWVWILNNLFFVCLAEEALFRGFIQNGLEKMLPRSKIYSLVSILVAAILFGLAHYKGGSAYVMLAAIAGLFYGYAFQKTKRLEVSIAVHFGLNLIHFLFFSYPALN